MTSGLPASLHVAALRLAARTGRVRKASLALARVFPSNDAILEWSDGARMQVRLADPYWSRVTAGLDYEPEVEFAFRAALALHPDAAILDIGANIGYWSVRFASMTDIIAVEAVPDTYDQLATNAAANHFRAVHAAVWNKSGETVTIRWDDDRHGAASIVGNEFSKVAEVATVTLDDVYAEYGGGRTAIVKLDVEGAEGAALEGGADLLPNALLIYEDHGKDPHHTVSRQVADIGLRIAAVSEGLLRPIEDIAQLDAIKTLPRKGYNFVAFDPAGPWAAIETTGRLVSES